MTDEELRKGARAMRARFDGERDERGRRPLRPGEVAAIKRLGSVSDALLDGAFWGLANPLLALLLSREQRPETLSDEQLERRRDGWATALAVVVCAYGSAPAAQGHERFGQWLRRGLEARSGTEEGIALRFRQLVAARTPDELARRLRSIAKLVAQPVDWATLTEDVLQWCGSDRAREAVLRRWAQDFYGSIEDETDSRDEEKTREENEKE
jgi:CRISPR type I-E-associated protein CasB/Cse2